MVSLRQERINAQFKKLIAQFLRTRAYATTLVTVTNLFVTKNLEHAKAFVTIFPEQREEEVLNLIKKDRNALQEFLMENTRIKSIPVVDFYLDSGEKKRARVEELLRE